MQNIAEFQIIGRVGAIKAVGATLRVTVAANYPYYNETGGREDRVYWNEFTIFADKTKSFVNKYVGKGDLVFARGRIGQNNYERNGQTVYTVDLICNDFGLLAAKNAPAENSAAPAENDAEPEQATPAPRRRKAA